MGNELLTGFLAGQGDSGNRNNTDFYARMAHAFLDDEDAGENKIAKYYDCVVK